MPAPADGVLPEGFFSTTNLPTYVKVGGEWRLPLEPLPLEGLEAWRARRRSMTVTG